jgi:aminopeptidase N
VLLRDEDADPAIVAQMLTLPAESYLAELVEQIDPLLIHAARRAERTALALALHDELRVCHARCGQAGEYRVEPAQIARRSLRNACLGYLVLANADEGCALAERQYREQHNMTDVAAALAAVVHAETGAERTRGAALLTDFHARWQHEPLVMNLWLQIQAQRPSADTLADIQRLWAHPSFDERNPNKVRALLGAFCNSNAPGFHRADGAGYRLLAQRIAEIDTRNPQLAARLLAPLGRWRRHAEPYRGAMRQALGALRALPALSPDCFEVVSKSLAEPA